jgi:hypothetical protein
LVTRVKPNINLVEVHPQLSNKQTSSGWMVRWWGAGLLWPSFLQ